MSETRLKERCIVVSNPRSARLSGYRLEFNKVSQNNREGFANIVLDVNGVVEGVVYEIDEIDLQKLDKHEGYPEHYKRIKIDVRLRPGDEEVSAVAYIANPQKVKNGLKPTRAYLNHLLAGKNFLSDGYFQWLKQTETLD